MKKVFHVRPNLECRREQELGANISRATKGTIPKNYFRRLRLGKVQLFQPYRMAVDKLQPITVRCQGREIVLDGIEWTPVTDKRNILVIQNAKGRRRSLYKPVIVRLGEPREIPVWKVGDKVETTAEGTVQHRLLTPLTLLLEYSARKVDEDFYRICGVVEEVIPCDGDIYYGVLHEGELAYMKGQFFKALV